MQIINKYTVHQVPAPSFVLFCQLAVSALVTRVGGAAGIIEVDRFEWHKFKPFCWVVLGFLGTIFANIKVRAPPFSDNPPPQHPSPTHLLHQP